MYVDCILERFNIKEKNAQGSLTLLDEQNIMFFSIILHRLFSISLRIRANL